MDNEQIEIFKEETRELLEELESSMLKLEKNREDEALIAQIFRSLHTIKGSGAMFGFDDVSQFTHRVENIFDMLRKGKIEVTPELIDMGLSSLDIIRDMVKSDSGNIHLETRRNSLLETFSRFYEPSAIKQAG